MESKIKAVGALTMLEETQRDRIGSQLDAARQQTEKLESRLSALAELKSFHHGHGVQSRSRLSLMNMTMVDRMLQGMLNHQVHEQAVMQAECHAIQAQLQQKSQRVHGLEQVLERWKSKQKYEKAKRDQKIMEDIINSRLKLRKL
ncbi:flagellar export protein FliJ [Vibrio sp. ZSDZ65]|uniref:Flagellar FliJ protein n=1 Tax=Vibrio qingdaonensis TaxID=2829491 RepID=A0A9X3HWI0_9VIBR|nr:flagellar export protein FliJ [Vibrio qingdaonensis]MCW8346655.1 flagellar export protein FliJ [Vibrio qingdaonensis]